MDKIIANYTTQPHSNFPLDCETMEYIQNNQHLAEMLGAIAGDKVILSGCNQVGAKFMPGYVFLCTADYPQGEVVAFVGSEKAFTSVYLDKTPIAVTANSDSYPNAYTTRQLKPGLGSEQYPWAEFTVLTDKTNRQLLAEIASLRTQMASLQPAPVGSIMMWPSATIPANWQLCDGSSLNRKDYADLFTILGTTYGNSDDTTFKIPDMRGYFVAGKGANNYTTLNQKGGTNSVALSVNEMPKHNHNTANSTTDGNVTTAKDGQHSHTYSYTSANNGEVKHDGYNSITGITNTNKNTGEAGAHTHTVPLKASGAGIAHENRPPFIVLNYIIKTK